MTTKIIQQLYLVGEAPRPKQYASHTDLSQADFRCAETLSIFARVSQTLSIMTTKTTHLLQLAYVLHKP